MWPGHQEFSLLSRWFSCSSKFGNPRHRYANSHLTDLPTSTLPPYSPFSTQQIEVLLNYKSDYISAKNSPMAPHVPSKRQRLYTGLQGLTWAAVSPIAPHHFSDLYYTSPGSLLNWQRPPYFPWIHQASSLPRTVALSVPSVWNTLPPDIYISNISSNTTFPVIS